MLATLAAVAAVGYVALGAALFVLQPRLLYLPDIGRDVTTTPQRAGLAYEVIQLDVEPGVRVHGWYVPHPQARGTALVLHGNAGSIALRLDWLAMFHRLGYASLIIDYRGYGASTGVPTEQGTYRDAQAAWKHLVETRAVAPGEIVIVGESLGGAVAAWLAARVPARALVLQSAFTSVPDLAAELYPAFPVRWMSRFEYATREHVAATSVPVLVAHSRDDEIVPFAHGERLHQAARGLRAFVEQRGGHNEAFLFSRPQWTQALAEFLERASATR